MQHGVFSRRRVVGALGAAAALAAVPGGLAQPVAPPLRIGVSLGLSGIYATDAEMQGKAYRLWAEQVNRRGGIFGRRVEMIIRDDKSDPATARLIYEDYVRRDGADLLMGPYSSGITAAVAPIAERHGYPMLSPGGAAETLWKQGYRNLFGIIPVAGRHTIGFLAVLADAGVSRLAIVEADDVFSADVAEGTRTWAGEYGVRITSAQKIPLGSTDLEPAARVAQRSGAQALVMAGHFAESVNMRRALQGIGWMPGAYYASVGPGLDKYGSTLGSAAEEAFATTTWEPREDLKLPGTAEFLRDFVAAYGEKPNFLAAHAYAACQILERALHQAGRLDRALLRDSLAQLDTNALLGRYAVDRSGLQTKRLPLIVQWQQGRREIVWPEALRTAPAIVRT